MEKVDLEWLRKQFLIALAGDDDLFEILVLKGGNALSLVHNIGNRASLDIDYSMEGEAEDVQNLGKLIFNALRDRLGPRGFVIFDESFSLHPKNPTDKSDPRWGGYSAEFKVAQQEMYTRLDGNLDKIRKEALSISGDAQGKRTFSIQISKYEFCKEKEEAELDEGYLCYVYTLEMIAAEKLRSICQQMNEYEKRTYATARARDFYDLYALITDGGVEFSEEGVQEIIRVVFSTKEVPLKLLNKVKKYYDFHKSDWPAVQNSIPSTRSQEYDFYFDFVVGEIKKLETLWVKNTP